MKQVVHILATVRRPELLRAALLVFSTLRVGFPTADVCVWGNALQDEALAAVSDATGQVGGVFRNLAPTSHDIWIANLVGRLNEALWICDTDIVFRAPVEHWCAAEQCLFAGRYEPDFAEEWTDTVHLARLHTALMFIQPAALRCAMRGWMARFPLPWRNTARYPLIHQHFVPRIGGKPLFYDTMAGAYQAFVGDRVVRAFTEEENAAFEHLHFATYVDEIAPHLKGVQGGIAQRFEAVYDNPALAFGIQAEQQKYYATRAIVQTSKRERKHAV